MNKLILSDGVNKIILAKLVPGLNQFVLTLSGFCPYLPENQGRAANGQILEAANQALFAL